MNAEDAEEFTQSLGQIGGGLWRQIHLAEKLGVPKALGLTTKDWVQERLGGYIRLSVDERREAVKELTEQGLSSRKIAPIVGVSHVQVADDVKKLTPPKPVTLEGLTELGRAAGTIADPPEPVSNDEFLVLRLEAVADEAERLAAGLEPSNKYHGPGAIKAARRLRKAAAALSGTAVAILDERHAHG